MITKEEFERYNEIRKSGVTNMFNVKLVADLAHLTKEQCFEIMKDYSKLKEKAVEKKE